METQVQIAFLVKMETISYTVVKVMTQSIAAAVKTLLMVGMVTTI